MGVEVRTREWVVSQATSLKTMDSLFFGIHCLPIDPQLGVGLFELFPIHVGVWAGLVLSRSHAYRHSHREFMSAAVLSFLTNTLLLQTSTTSAPQPSRTSSLMVPEPWGEGYNIAVPYRVGHTTILYSLEAEQLKGYVGLTIHCKKE